MLTRAWLNKVVVCMVSAVWSQGGQYDATGAGRGCLAQMGSAGEVHGIPSWVKHSPCRPATLYLPQHANMARTRCDLTDWPALLSTLYEFTA